MSDQEKEKSTEETEQQHETDDKQEQDRQKQEQDRQKQVQVTENEQVDQEQKKTAGQQKKEEPQASEASEEKAPLNKTSAKMVSNRASDKDISNKASDKDVSNKSSEKDVSDKSADKDVSNKVRDEKETSDAEKKSGQAAASVDNEGEKENKKTAGGDEAPAGGRPEKPAAARKRPAGAAAKRPAGAAGKRPAGAARKRPAAKAKEEEKPKGPSKNQPYLDKYVKVLKDNIGEEVLEDAYINDLAKEIPTIIVKKERWYEVAEFLKHNEQLTFDYLSALHGTDFETHMEVYYEFYSFKENQSIAVKVKLDRDQPEIASVTPIWAGADWPEREAYDLLGIRFEGHPNLTRILLTDDWVGHPLRKDYEQHDEEV